MTGDAPGDARGTLRVRPPPEAMPLVEAVREAGGPAVRAVLLFGSQLVRTAPDAHSAWDVVVVVDAYPPFHRHLVAAGHHRRPAWLLNLLARVLPPSITALDPGGGAPLAKCAIVSAADFRRALGLRAPDHFLKGRMVQKVALAWARDAGNRREIEGLLADARADVLRWVGPYLDGPVTAAELARRMLEVSYGAELRPESGDRVRQVFEAQRAFLEAAFDGVLREAAAGGRAEPIGDRRYRVPRGPRWRRVGLSLYFLRSKARATARWLKHVVTFNDWLTYIQRKVERRTGMTIELTPWERRLPLLLLWPKAIRVIRSGRAVGRREAEAPSTPPERSRSADDSPPPDVPIRSDP